MSSCVRFLCASALVATITTPAMATESGGGVYPNGAESFMTGALPPPGGYFVNYTTYYSAGQFKNNNAAFKTFDATVAADVMRGIYVTPVQVLGGTWAMHAFVPVTDVNVTMGSSSAHRSGLGDIIVDPFILGWHAGDFHWLGGFDVSVPTGAYDKNSLANPGRNYWAFTPVAAITWRNGAGWELSTKVMYDINTENRDTDYRSGNELHADFIAAKHFDQLAVGLGGYAYRQITGDSGAGAVLGEFKGQAVALGPQVSYQLGGVGLEAKYQKEFAVENRPEGDKLWLRVNLSF